MRHFAYAFCIALLCSTTPLLADPGGKHGGGDWGDDDHGRGHGKKHGDHGHGRDKHNHHGKHKHKHDKHADARIRDQDRVVIRRYLADDYHEHCPPGLAKKHNGCMPPGQARHYVVGQYLPATVVYEPVPQPLLVQLQPVPMGYQYVMVDKDVFLISEGTKKIVDAITLFSAVGH